MGPNREEQLVSEAIKQLQDEAEYSFKKQVLEKIKQIQTHQETLRKTQADLERTKKELKELQLTPIDAKAILG